MNEKRGRNPNTNCLQFGHIDNERGEAILRDILIPRDGKIYAVTVGTPVVLEEIKHENARITDPELKIDENIYVIEDISNFDKVCEELRTSVPFEILEPYARLQNIGDVIDPTLK